MEQWTYWLHLPGVLLDGGTERAWADGHLCRLDHDAWHELDQTVWQPVDFADCKPVFYRGQVTGGRGPFVRPDGSVLDTVLETRSRLHRALSLVSDWPLPPDPRLSCGYLKSGEGRCHTFIVGPSGRDWILTGHFRAPRQLLDAELLEEAERCHRQLLALRESLPDSWLEGALESLTLASLPDVYVGDGGPPRWHVAFLNAVAVLENLVLADRAPEASGQESITTAFSRRVAVLIADEFDEVSEISDHLRSVYRLRSDLIHGRRGLDLADAEAHRVVNLGLGVLQLVLRRILALLAGRGAVHDVAELAQAAAEPEHFEALSKAIERGAQR